MVLRYWWYYGATMALPLVENGGMEKSATHETRVLVMCDVCVCGLDIIYMCECVCEVLADASVLKAQKTRGCEENEDTDKRVMWVWSVCGVLCGLMCGCW
jgi:hypothetical protein